MGQYSGRGSGQVAGGTGAREQTGWSGRRAGVVAGACTCRTFTPRDVVFTPTPHMHVLEL